MFNFLDVAIGLIFVFTLISLIGSAVVEALSAMLSQRARMLWRAIEKLVGSKVREEISREQLVRGLAQGGRVRGEPEPSYLEAKLFTLALLQQAFEALPDGGAEAAEPRDLAKLRTALSKCLPRPGESARSEGDATITEKQEALAPIARALLLLIEDAVDLDEAKRRISAWYDAAMTRLSGVYKRWTQVALFVVGLVLAVGVGVDALAITKSLWENAPLRASTLELAQAFAEDFPEHDHGDEPSDVIERRLSEARGHAAQLQQSRFPLHPFSDRDCESDWLREHWLGFLLSALATAMGAPFWFDLLGRFISLRTSVKPPVQPSPKQESTAPSE